MKILIKMAILDLLNVGNVDPGYQTPRFKANFRMTHFDPANDPTSWVVKCYELRQEGKKQNLPEWNQIQALLTNGFRSTVDRELGLGFVIVSESVVNLSMWRKDFPHLPHQTLWTLVSPPHPFNWSRSNCNVENSYCLGEGRIYTHERAIWEKFLNSPRTERDKWDYVNGILIEN